MSDITTLLKRYKAGEIGWPSVLHQLGPRTYTDQERYTAFASQADPFRAEEALDAAPHYTDGSWDEVENARIAGLITQAEYNELAATARAAH